MEKLNRYFVPLYVDNDTANRLLAEAGRKPYASKEEWQLVQTHLIEPDGTFHELWRPGPFTGRRDPEDLAAALDRENEHAQAQPDAAADKRCGETSQGGRAPQGIGRLHGYFLSFPAAVCGAEVAMALPRGSERWKQRGI